MERCKADSLQDLASAALLPHVSDSEKAEILAEARERRQLSHALKCARMKNELAALTKI